MKREYIHFVLLCLGYLLLMNIFNNFELGHDQARHANDGALWYYYLHGYGAREFASYDAFITSFPEFSRSKIAWYFLYDPPVHALMTAASYTVFGMNEFAARLPSQLLNILGIFFLFLLAKEFTSEKNALLIAFLYGCIPLVFHLGRDAMIDAGAASFLIGWMYYSFFLASKYEGWKKYCCFFVGGIALALAILTKYTAVFFFVGFLAVYETYLFWKSFKNKEKLFSPESKQLLFCIIIQIGLLVVLSLPWISYSWFSGGILEKLTPVRTENWTQQGYLYNISYLFYELTIESIGLFVFLFLLYFGRKAMHQKHAPLLSFIAATLFVVPLYFTNIQPRYFLAVFAFALLIIFGLLTEIFSEKTARRIFTSYLCIFVFISITLSYLVLQNNGAIDTSSFDATFSAIKGSALFFGYYGNFDTVDIVSGPHILAVKSWWQYWNSYFFKDTFLFHIELNTKNPYTNHYANPDLFMFRFFQKLETHPDIGFVYLSAAELQGEYGSDVLQIMNSTKESIPTYFIVPNTNQGEEYISMEQFLAGVNTQKYSYLYWDFYEVK